MPTIDTPPLCIAGDATFWPWRTRIEFAGHPPQPREGSGITMTLL